MVQETRSPEGQLSDTPGEQSAEGPPHPKKKSRRWIGCGIGGCLSIPLCLAAGVGILMFSGVLSGTYGNSDEWPDWSADGSRTAFVAYIFNSSNRAIYVMNADGSDIVQLTGDLDDAYHPSWSPDGSRIAFVISRDGDSDIYIMNADGSNQVNLTGE
jgi:hypothetical protein